MWTKYPSLYTKFGLIQVPDEAFSWELLRQLSGIDPREVAGDNAYKLSNGLLGDKDEKSLFNMLAWYLEPEVSLLYSCGAHVSS